MTSAEHIDFRRFDFPGSPCGLHARYVRQSFARHAHEELTFGVVTHGAGAFDHRGAGLVATADHLVAINPEAIHTGSAATPQGWTQRMLYLPRETLASLGEEVDAALRGGLHLPEALIHDPGVASRFVRAHALLMSRASTLTKQTTLTALLEHILTRHARPRPTARAAGREHAAVATVREHLHANVCRQVSLARLAALTGLAPAYLVRVFTRDTGMPPHAYQTMLRVRTARNLLATGTPIAEAAAATGFADQPHLSRAFKRIYGLTPGRFREVNIVQDRPRSAG
jgi:AraC-like DNA-binding protein